MGAAVNFVSMFLGDLHGAICRERASTKQKQNLFQIHWFYSGQSGLAVEIQER